MVQTVDMPADMGHRPRWYAPDTVCEVTNRTVQERFLLRPSEESRALLVGVIARALVLFGAVRVHAFIFLSNHCHLLISAANAEQLAPFLGFVFGNSSREMGRIHQWQGPLWARPCSVIPILDEDAQIDRLRYVLLNAVKEGLVSSPREWPGATTTEALLGDMTMSGTWIERDQLRRAERTWRRSRPTTKQFARELTFQLHPLPCWRHLSPEQLRARHQLLVESVEHQGSLRRTLYLGVSRLLETNPHARPENSKHEHAPSCHASHPRTVELFRAMYREFVATLRRTTASLLHRPPDGIPRGAFACPTWFADGSDSLDLLAWPS